MLGTCKEAHRMVAESLDHQLPFWRGARLRLHLLACDACRGFKRQMQWLSRAMRRLDDS
jgi:predicted anti-sigma-YlaC factor YlaD